MYGFSPEMLQMLQGAGVQPQAAAPGPMQLPQFAAVPPGVQQQPGVPPEVLMGLGGEGDGSKPFPTNAAMLAALGAAGMGLRTGQRPPPPNPGGLPMASSPGRGMPVQQFRLPR